MLQVQVAAVDVCYRHASAGGPGVPAVCSPRYGRAASATTPVMVPTSTNPPARVGLANREVWPTGALARTVPRSASSAYRVPPA